MTKQTLPCDNYDNDIWEHHNQYLTCLCSVQHPATGKGKHLMNEQTDIAIVVWLSFSIVPTSIFLIYDIYDIDSQILSSVLFPILALLPETCPNLPPCSVMLKLFSIFMCKTFRRREWVRAAVVDIFHIFFGLRFLFIFQFSNSFKWLEATLIDAEGVSNGYLVDFYSAGQNKSHTFQDGP